MHPCRRHPHAGFTLLEMLIAVAVFALVVLALLNLVGESTRTAVMVEERVLAGIVAGNRAVEAAIEPAANLSALTAGVEQLGGREWRWTRQLAPTDDPALLRIAIDVHPAGSDRIAAELVAFRAAR